MKPLYFITILCCLNVASFGQDFSKDVDFTSHKVITTTTTTNAATTDITYTGVGNSYNLEVKNNSTFTIDLQGTHTLFTRGDGPTAKPGKSAVELVIEEGSMLIIDGNLDVGSHTDITLQGNMIITGNLLNSDRFTNGGYGDIDIKGNGLLYIGGTANLDYIDLENAENIFIEESYEAPHDRSRISDEEFALLERNKGSNPFSTIDGLDVDEHNYNIDLWNIDHINSEDQSNDELTNNPFPEIKVVTASGWYNQYIKIRGEGFVDGELSSSSEFYKLPITSLNTLEDIIKKIKWSVKNSMVNDNVLLHHEGNDKDDFPSDVKREITDYFNTSRKIIVSFVDDAPEIEYVASSGRMKSVSVEEINIFTSDGDLPVELIYFTGVKNVDNTVNLKWATATEVNNDRFEIYKSLDKRSWNKIGEVAAQGGNSNYRIDYSFVDEDVNNQQLYKLVQVDYNGDTETFGPISISAEEEGALEVNVFPNPSDTQDDVQLYIKGISLSAELQVGVYTKYGKLIKTIEINQIDQSSMIMPLDLGLSSGMYLIKVQNGVEVANSKLLIQ